MFFRLALLFEYTRESRLPGARYLARKCRCHRKGARPYNRTMIFESFPVGPLACNCTILGDEEAHEAIVIDPGDDVSHIHRRLTELGLKLKQILVTHAHIDHVGGAFKLKRLTGAPIFLNENDLPLLKEMAAQAAWLGMSPPEVGAARREPHRRSGCRARTLSRAGAAHSWPHPGIGVPALRPAQTAHCRRYPLCRQHRPHRPARRQFPPDHRFSSFPASHTPRRNRSSPRPRPRNNHRRRTQQQPISAVSDQANSPTAKSKQPALWYSSKEQA